MEHTADVDTSSVTLKGPVPPIRRINFDGQEYAHTQDIVGWLNYIADNIVDANCTEAEQADQAVVARVISILANFTSQRLAV